MSENYPKQVRKQTFRERKLNTGYPGKIPGYPAQKVWFPWLRVTYRTFQPPPLHVENPHPTRGYPDPKVWVWGSFFFPELWTLVEHLLPIWSVFQSGNPVQRMPVTKTTCHHRRQAGLRRAFKPTGAPP